MSGIAKAGGAMVGVGLAGAVLLKVLALGGGYVMNLQYIHLSFWPFLTLFMFALGIGTIFFDYVRSGVLTLVVFVVGLVFGIYIWSMFFGFAGIFGLGTSTGFPFGLVMG